MSEINKKELEQVLTKEVLKANEELFVLFHPKDHPKKSSLPSDWMDRDEMDTALDEYVQLQCSLDIYDMLQASALAKHVSIYIAW
jgi:hypothetical protein